MLFKAYFIIASGHNIKTHFCKIFHLTCRGWKAGKVRRKMSLISAL